MSKTSPNGNNPMTRGMLGSTESETGTSVWLGSKCPCPLTPDNAKNWS